MKTVMHLNRIEETIAWTFGLIGGGLAYANMPALLHIDFSFLASKILGLLWTGCVALFSGAMGVIGKRIVERSKWLKSLFKPKK